MKTILNSLTTLSMLFFLANTVVIAKPTNNGKTRTANQDAKKTIAPLMYEINNLSYFMSNAGQVQIPNPRNNQKLAFLGQAAGQQVYFTNKGLVFQTQQFEEVSANSVILDRFNLQPMAVSGYRLHTTYLNRKSDLQFEAVDALETKFNFYNSVADQEALQVSLYQTLTINELYPGISVKFSALKGSIIEQYTVAAGANSQQLAFDFEAGSLLLGADGSLSAETGFGSFLKNKPVAMQNNISLPCYWIKMLNGSYQLSIEGLNPFETLTITTQWEITGAIFDQHVTNSGSQAVNDGKGNSYVTGKAVAMLAANKASKEQIAADAFVAKINDEGKVEWISFYGGEGLDMGLGLTVDAFGFVYVSGITSSTQNIASKGAHHNNLNAVYDGFIVKFNNAGIRQWGTYYGGNGVAYANEITTDNSGDIYLTGTTYPNDKAEEKDSRGFMVKFDASGVYQWGTH